MRVEYFAMPRQNGLERRRESSQTHPSQSTMPTCSGTCKNGSGCHHNAKPGHSVCGKHMTQDQGIIVVPCGHTMTNGNQCTNPRGEGLTLCVRHHRMQERRERRRRIEELMFAALDALWTDGDVEIARQRLLAGLTDGQIDQEKFENLTEVLEEEIAFWEHLHRMPRAVVPQSDLHRLSLDGQSVHTKEVSKQTNETLKLLLETPTEPDHVEAFHRIHWQWCDKPYNPGGQAFRDVMRDMKQWYNTPTCRTENDWLYKRALDGLWARIKTSSMKDELLQRLWEEAYESLKMCCDGHISRLCNVFVGFDEAFKPQVSIGELLQQKMAAIAEKDISVERKVGEAWLVFEELGIPREQRMEWIEAF